MTKNTLIKISLLGVSGIILYQVLFNFILPIILFVVLISILKGLIKGFDQDENIQNPKAIDNTKDKNSVDKIISIKSEEVKTI